MRLHKVSDYAPLSATSYNDVYCFHGLSHICHSRKASLSKRTDYQRLQLIFTQLFGEVTLKNLKFSSFIRCFFFSSPACESFCCFDATFGLTGDDLFDLRVI